MTVHAIKKPKPGPRSPERQVLATVITEKRAVDAKLEAARGAVARAGQLVSDSEAKLAAAGAAVTRAKEHHTTAVAKSIGQGVAAPTSALVRAARAAQSDLADEHDAALAALERLRIEFADVEALAKQVHVRVEAAANGVLAAAGFPLVERLLKLREEIHALFSALVFIRNRGRERFGSSATFRVVPELSAPLAQVEEEIAAAIEAGISFDVDAASDEILEQWHQATNALRADPDHELPVMRGSE